MNILIIEDEKRVALQLRKQILSVLPGHELHLKVCLEMEEGLFYLKSNQVDLLFLDLNLNGFDGFDILKEVSSESFSTIITSAYRQRALEAFDYGVLDFVPKPYELKRLEKAINRWMQQQKISSPAKYLVVKKALRNEIIEVSQLVYLQADGHHTFLYLTNNREEEHHKSLDQLLQLLPSQFERIHKSYAVNMAMIKGLDIQPGSKYRLILKNGKSVPIGRKYYKSLKIRFI